MKPAPFLFLFLFLLFTQSCDRDTCCDDPVEETKFQAPEPQEYRDLQENTLGTFVREIPFNAEEGITFTPNSGTVLQISPDCLTTSEGEPVTGNVTLVFAELYERDEMLAADKPTMGITAAGENTFLVSGGIFHISFTQNRQALTNNCGIQLQVPVTHTSGTDQEMSLWNGMRNDNGSFSWAPFLQGELFVEGDRYITFLPGDPGWIGIARFRDFPESGTTLRVLVSEGYNAGNASVYLAYSGEKHGLAQLSAFDPETNMFSDPSRQIPAGREIHLIFVTADDDQWRYAIKSITTEENQVHTIAHSETTTATASELQSVIAELP